MPVIKTNPKRGRRRLLPVRSAPTYKPGSISFADQTRASTSLSTQKLCGLSEAEIHPQTLWIERSRNPHPLQGVLLLD
ncbi:MAG: hypothetical protein RBJ76_12835 [Stenomitos frigidus ULC029]